MSFSSIGVITDLRDGRKVKETESEIEKEIEIEKEVEVEVATETEIETEIETVHGVKYGSVISVGFDIHVFRWRGFSASAGSVVPAAREQPRAASGIYRCHEHGQGVSFGTICRESPVVSAFQGICQCRNFYA